MENSIQIRNVGKCYKLYDSRRNRLKDWLLPGDAHRYAEKWVLRGVDLEVRAGEAVGIIGMNGAGKSTLLKIVTGTTAPTEGTVAFHGSVAALLELGLGFHPEFTGRQNIYMSGQLLGYTVDEINQCMAEIESFAEIGEAVDAPVRTYSSGMQVRLAFSVATMKRPDILIVDEALSVGDAYFQHKSFGRIKAFCEAGTTLLLVSHDKAAIQAVCDRAVLLHEGKVFRSGAPEEIMDYYNAMLVKDKDNAIQQKRLENDRVQTVFGNGKVEISSVRLMDMQGKDLAVVDVGTMVKIYIEGDVRKDVPDLSCGIQIKNKLGEAVYGINTGLYDQVLYDLTAGEKISFAFIFPMNIGTGNYSFSVAFHSGASHMDNNYQWLDLALIFEVINQSKPLFEGAAYLGATVQVQRGGMADDTDKEAL